MFTMLHKYCQFLHNLLDVEKIIVDFMSSQYTPLLFTPFSNGVCIHQFWNIHPFVIYTPTPWVYIHPILNSVAMPW